VYRSSQFTKTETRDPPASMTAESNSAGSAGGSSKINNSNNNNTGSRGEESGTAHGKSAASTAAAVPARGSQGSVPHSESLGYGTASSLSVTGSTGSQLYGRADAVNGSLMTAYEKLTFELENDDNVQKEITLGRRIGFYRIRGELGTGNFSQVKLATHALTKEKVAIKILDKTKLDAKTQRLLSREVSVMERLHHPCVIRLYEVMESVAKIHIVMEYAPGGELFTKITSEGRFSERHARVIFSQVASAIKHMHDHNVIHRDLKAENVFFSGPSHVKVGDFGFSTLAKPQQELNTFCGSPPYAAPELFRDDSYQGPRVDIWALGIMLYFMLTGLMPFRADTVGRLKKLILAGEYSMPAFLSEPAQALIASILRLSPPDRATMSDIQSSAWLEGEEFLPALEKYEMNPRRVANRADLRPEELEVRKNLQQLGISESLLEEASGKSYRSSITGTYRIALHKVHKRESGEITFTPPSSAALSRQERQRGGGGGGGGGGGRRGGGDRQQQQQQQQQASSKACTVL
ncbi:hypothetical protein BOX15_Mlig007816g1, partial [Macrostomum lignano]